MNEYAVDTAWPAFQAALRAIIDSLSPFTPLRSGLDSLLTILIKDLGYARAHLMIFGETHQSVRISMSKSRESGFGHLYGPGALLVGQVAVTKRGVIVDNLDGHPDFSGRPPLELETLSCICAPIPHPKRHGPADRGSAPKASILGLVCVDLAKAPTVFLESHRGFLELIAAIVGLRADRFEAELAKPVRSRKEEPVEIDLEAQVPSKPLAASKAMRLVLRQVAQAAASNAPVLIRGEEGTGKEFMAETIHAQSARAAKPLVRFSGQEPGGEQAATALFGVQKGRTPGATQTRKGAFEQADGGALFLSDVEDLPLPVQSELLHAVEHQEITRKGADKPTRINVRLICASTKPLEELVSQGVLLEDLLYAIGVFPIFIPALRDRPGDVLPLAEHFLTEFSRREGKEVKRISTPAIDLLGQYHWPGNVRELRGCMEKAVAICNEGVIRSYHLPPTLQTAESSATDNRLSFGEAVAGYERELLVEALKKAGGNMFKAARDLRESYRIVNYKVKKYGLDPKRFVSMKRG